MYEMLYIIPPPYTEEDAPNIQKSIDKIIEENGGKIIHEENLGNKKLAYPIKDARRGFYILVNFEIPPQNLKSINQKLKLMPEVLRSQIITVKMTTKKPAKKREKLALKPKTEGEAAEIETEKVDFKTLDEQIDKLLEI